MSLAPKMVPVRIVAALTGVALATGTVASASADPVREAAPPAPAAAPPARAPGAIAPPGSRSVNAASVDAAGLVAALAEADTAAFVRELDRLLYEDVVAGLPPDDRPARPPCPLDLLGRSLSTTTVLLAFLPDGDTVWAAAVENGAVHARRLDAPHTSALGPRLAAWAADPAAAAYDAHAALVIHNNLFPPFGRILARKRHLIVAGGGVLRAIPFEALLLALPDTDDPSARPYLLHRFEVSHEATLGSRLGWSSRSGELRRLRTDDSSGSPLDRPIADGTLPAVASKASGEDTAAASLFWLRKGARGALLGGSEGGMDTFLRAYFRERASGRRPDVRTVHRARAVLLRAGAPIEAWAWPRLFGAE